MGPIHYAGFHCLGTEAGLASCQVTQNSTIAEITNCRHFEDAGVRCTIGRLKPLGDILGLNQIL